MQWDAQAQMKFEAMISKVPVFLRDMVKDKVGKRAELLAQQAQKSLVTEKDLVDAFFAETPFGFHGPMKSDMQELGINYTQYGHPQ